VHRARLFAQEKHHWFRIGVARISDSFQAFDSTRKRRPTTLCPAPATCGNLRSRRSRADWGATVASLRMSTATSVVRQVRRRTGCPRIGTRSGMARQVIARRRFRAPQTSLTGRIVDPPARDGDARDEGRRPATVRGCSWKRVVRRPRFVASSRAMPPTVGRVIPLCCRVAAALRGPACARQALRLHDRWTRQRGRSIERCGGASACRRPRRFLVRSRSQAAP
jgi:hypothetical protein